MKIYNDIKILNSIIKDQKQDLSFVKDKTRRKILIERINKLVDVRNSFYGMITYKYKLDALDSLLTYIISDYLMRYYVENGGNFRDNRKEYYLSDSNYKNKKLVSNKNYNKDLGLPLKMIIDKIDFKLRNTSQENTYFLANEISSYLIENAVDGIKTEENEVVIKNISNLPSVEEINKLVNETLFDIKTFLKWKIK